MTGMTPAERLRDAAKRLREVAGAATPGPWEADGDEISQHWSRPEPWQPVASGEVACMAYCYGGSARGIDRDEDADYIAMMSPPVALALADWLDDLADHDPSPLMPTEVGAFKVADAVLGGEER